MLTVATNIRWNFIALVDIVVENPLILKFYRLAPVFDKLPMLFSPVDRQLIEREFRVPVADADVISAWNDAVALAKIFWDKVAREKSLAAGFRKIARRRLAELH